jgi:hypothetical protein
VAEDGNYYWGWNNLAEWQRDRGKAAMQCRRRWATSRLLSYSTAWSNQ